MKEIKSTKHTTVKATDEKEAPDFGHHTYDVVPTGVMISNCRCPDKNHHKVSAEGRTAVQFQHKVIIDDGKIATVQFQKGPLKEAGLNGVMNEDLIVMVIDRLEAFQESPFKCRENAVAITKLQEALMWLRKRTEDREERNVEGTHQV